MKQNKYPSQASRKFYLRKSLHTTLPDVNLNLAIRKNNIKNYIKNDMNITKLFKQSKEQEDDGLQNHLKQLKKQCSELSRQIKNKDDETIRLKNQGMQISEKSKQIKQNKQNLQKKIDQIQKKIQQLNYKKEMASLSSKTYLHILDRMRRDQIVEQFTKNKYEEQIRNLQKLYLNFQLKYQSITQFQKLSSLGLKDAKQTIQQQNNSRAKNISVQKRQLQQKIDKTKKLRQREKQTQLIKQLASDDIQDVDLQKLKKFITVHIFLRNLLKNKMMKLKCYYQPYQLAFYKIKSNTNVKDFFSLKQQFFNFEQSYNEKAYWVKNLQKQIKQEQIKKKQLQQKLLQFRIKEMEVISKLQNKQNNELNLKQKMNKKQLTEKSLQHELIFQKIQNWVLQQQKKLGLQNEQNVQAFQSFNRLIQHMELIKKK